MSISSKKVKHLIKEIEKKKSIEDFALSMQRRSDIEIEELNLSGIDNDTTKVGQQKRIHIIEKKMNLKLKSITHSSLIKDTKQLKGHIENYIGMAQIPIGIAGPLLINGAFSHGEYYIPLATTEGALVASYNRGMKAAALSGGITAACLTEVLQRSPFFKFKDVHSVAQFLVWVNNSIEAFQSIVGQVSRYAKLIDLKSNIEGNSAILSFEYSTGDAAGQNMVTICTAAICKYILAQFPIRPIEWYIESNFSGDKKATALSFTNVK